MAEMRCWTGSTRGRFVLGESYGEPGPGLGTLYEAWKVGSGRPALVLLPEERVEWRPDGPWRVIIECDPLQDSVALDVKQCPPEASLTELANLLALTSSMVERVEEHPRVQAHLARGPRRLPAPWISRAHRVGSLLALTGMAVFALGVGVGLLTSSASRIPNKINPFMTSQAFNSTNAPYIAYPLPAKPFADQATAPCHRYEVEFNKGCWLLLDQRPPCEKDIFLEHQGKCYVPAAKRARVPQAFEPSAP